MMPIAEVKKILQGGNKRARTAVQLAMYGAPLLRGIKPAALIMAERGEAADIGAALENTDITCFFLKGRGERTALYLYRKKELGSCLASGEVRKFLCRFGYMSYDVEAVLGCFSERIGLYHGGSMEFPHEVGVLLGYPLPDVKGFIKNRGTNYLMNGYWKVYQNVEETAGLFKRFDRERERAVRDVIAGKEIAEITV